MAMKSSPVENMLDFYRPHNRSDTWYTGELVDENTGEVSTPPSMTKQSFVEQCDINNILKQFKASGMLTHINQQAAQGRYLDLPDDLDYQNALNIVLEAENSFASLPSKVRDRFHNDPAEFLQWFQDPDNQDEAIKLGLATDNRPPPQAAPEALPSPPQSKGEPNGV